MGAGVGAQQKRAQTAVPEDPGFKPQNAHDNSQPSRTPVSGASNTLSQPVVTRHAHDTQMDIDKDIEYE